MVNEFLKIVRVSITKFQIANAQNQTACQGKVVQFCDVHGRIHIQKTLSFNVKVTFWSILETEARFVVKIINGVSHQMASIF